VRLIREDLSASTLYEIYENYCDSIDQYKDAPQISFVQQLKDAAAIEDFSKRGKVEILNLKTEIMDNIANQFIPVNILQKVSIR